MAMSTAYLGQLDMATAGPVDLEFLEASDGGGNGGVARSGDEAYCSVSRQLQQLQH
jgi:hypothetical protein